MVAATRKQVLTTIDGTPKKRLFLSIISDYDLKTGICELIDNALDHWVSNGRRSNLNINVTLDYERQFIEVYDDAGGVADTNADLLISPGASGNAYNQTLIGIFGVGGKRAGVALGELVEIRTCHKSGKSFQVDLTKEWIEQPGWDLDIYAVPSIPVGTTTVTITKVRQSFDEAEVYAIRLHLAETYSYFINEGCNLSLNSIRIEAVSFDKWAYPPAYLPQHVAFRIEPAAGKFLDVTITGGLILDREPDKENYGAYFFCNDRLIVKELKTRDVGYFVSAEAGVPHPDASLARVLIEFHGPAELMPWNSSKSGINFSHPAFLAIRKRIIDFMSYYTQVSRRLKTDWGTDVFKYKSGVMTKMDPSEGSSPKKKVLPKLPSTRQPTRIEVLKDRNAKALRDMPWTLGLVEAMGMVDIIGRHTKFETKNRAALILLDSNFEIALKEFIVHRKDLFPAHKYTNAFLGTLFGNRTNVIKEVQAHVNFSNKLIAKVGHYYDIRNNLTHQRASVLVTDEQIKDYENVIETVLGKLFSLKFPQD